MEKNIQKGMKGITLIALVITIIVILILAGVTISQLTGSDSAPAKANEAKQANNIGAVQDAIALAVQNAQMEAYDDVYVDNNSTVPQSQASTTVGQKVIDDVFAQYGTPTISGNKKTIETTKGDVTIKLEQETGENAKITLTTIDIEQEGTIKINGGTLSWNNIVFTIVSDTGTTGLSIGDELENSNGERFYVIPNDSNTSSDKVTLLAKYNLNIAGTAQAPNASYEETGCAFSSDKYWATEWSSYTDWSTKKFDINGVSGNVAGDAVTKAKTYGETQGGVGRLLTYEEVNSDGDQFVDSGTLHDIFCGKGNTQSDGNYLCYWLGSAYVASETSVWVVLGNYEGLLNVRFDLGNIIGVRPVITISKSIVK